MYILDYDQNGIKLNFCITDENQVRFVQCSQTNRIDVPNIDMNKYFWHRLVELHLSGSDQNDHHFSKHTGSSEGFTLEYVQNDEIYINDGTIFYIEQKNNKVNVKTFFRFYNNTKAFKTWNEVTNISNEPIGLEYISSFNFLGINSNEDWEKTTNIYIPHNYWLGECIWTQHDIRDLGLYNVGKFSGKRISLSNTGTWSTKEYLPMGILENTKDNEFFLWQIESSSSWNWEISTMSGQLYLMLNGPTFSENGWFKQLGVGETFKTVDVAISFGKSLEDSIKNITDYRRAIRRKNKDNIDLPIIFNDYMNCLNADPTTEKELPLINKAAELGCEYYCIDAGWYSIGYWWDNVGEWLPCESRFNGSFQNLLEYIRSKGMVAGLWLELEVMGIHCHLAATLPDDYFFMRNGSRVIDHSRYQLDFSNPNVIEFANSVIKRVVEEYGVGYIKMDYNINAGVGNERYSDSLGDGILKHSEAYLAWIDTVFKNYPDLIIENCASGGCRMDYAMLSRLSIQSTSDQTDYRKYAVIAANCISAVAPEQAAVWSYPLAKGDEEEVVYNMVNCMLLRIHQSGNIAELSETHLKLVEDALKLYKDIRKHIKNSYGVWPNGFAKPDDRYITFGIKLTDRILLAVWNQDNMDKIEINLKRYGAKRARVMYPVKLPTDYLFDKDSGVISIKPSQRYMARLFEIKF